MKQELSIEDGFQIVMLFAQEFWYYFFNKKAAPSLSSLMMEDNDFFFLCVCTGTSSNDYFETVIENKLSVPKKEQHQGLKVSEEVLFQLTIDLCRYFNERFKAEGRDSLRLAINWLSDMEQNPKDHQKEWAIWNEMVVAVTEHGEKSMGSF